MKTKNVLVNLSVKRWNLWMDYLAESDAKIATLLLLQWVKVNDEIHRINDQVTSLFSTLLVA